MDNSKNIIRTEGLNRHPVGFFIAGAVLGCLLWLTGCNPGNFVDNASKKTSTKKDAVPEVPGSHQSTQSELSQQPQEVAVVPPDLFLQWLDRHPDIATGLALSGDAQPVNPAVAKSDPQYIKNLSTLYEKVSRVFSPAIADKYAHLLLAMALTREVFDNSASTLETTPKNDVVEPDVKKLVDYLRSQQMDFISAITQAGTVLAQAGIDATGKQMSGEGPEKVRLPSPKKVAGFWGKVALAMNVFPQRGSKLPIPEFTVQLIRHQESAPKDVAWPAFPIQNAPYPVLALLRENPLPERELEYIWQEYTADAARRKTLMAYGNYTWGYEKLEVQYKTSAWHPASIPRLIEDGGVCGRLSGKGEQVRRGLGVPTTGVGQPNHRAYLAYGYNAETKITSVSLPQAIRGPEESTAAWALPVLYPGLPGVWQHYALAASLNRVGLVNYHSSQAEFLLAMRETDSQLRRAGLARALSVNPYNGYAWLALASDTPKTERDGLINKLEKAILGEQSLQPDDIFNPNLPADADLGQKTDVIQPKPVKGVPNYGKYLSSVLKKVIEKLK